MYKQLKRQLDDKVLLDKNIKELDDRIRSIIHKQLGLKGTSYSDIKLERALNKNDKFVSTFAKVENLDKEKESLVEERKIIVNFINDVYKSIDNMNNIELKVFKCRYMLGLTQSATAERLGYSLIRIKQIEKEIANKM